MRSYVLPMEPALARKVSFASAATRLTSAEFVRAAVTAALDTLAERDEHLSMAFKFIDTDADPELLNLPAPAKVDL